LTRPDFIETLAAACLRQGDASSDYDLNAGIVLPADRSLRPAAVLIGVTTAGDVILTKRSSQLRHHPGQISFPGGAQDMTDPTPQAAALREASEEIGLPSAVVTVLGQLPPHETVTGFSVTPVIGWVHADFAEIAEAGEVAEVFRVPLSHVLNPDRYVIEQRLWRGAPRKFFAVPYGPYYIWGATARILRGLAERVGG